MRPKPQKKKLRPRDFVKPLFDNFRQDFENIYEGMPRSLRNIGTIVDITHEDDTITFVVEADDKRIPLRFKLVEQ